MRLGSWEVSALFAWDCTILKNRQYYPVEGDDPYIRLVAPNRRVFVNTHCYFDEDNMKRYAYSDLTLKEGEYDHWEPYEINPPPKGTYVIVDGR